MGLGHKGRVRGGSWEFFKVDKDHEVTDSRHPVNTNQDSAGMASA